jgi:geranylgeranyl diphosphate synthase type I
VSDLPDYPTTIKEVGEALVKAAFEDLLSNKIYSKTALKILKEYSMKWKDYFRPALMIFACKSVGGNPSMVSPAAKALILASGGLDIHDDIIDESFVRSEKMYKTMVGQYGVSRSLLIGDCLIIGGLKCLHELWHILPKDKALAVVQAINQGLFELGSAEMEELNFVRNFQVTPRRYLRLVRMKAADVEAYTKIGGIIGGGSEEEIDALANFGRLLGMIAILRDDYHDTFYDKKELFSRITKESLPLPIVYSLGDDRCITLLNEMLQQPGDENISRLVSLLKDNGSEFKTKKTIDNLVQRAKKFANRTKDPRILISIFR